MPDAISFFTQTKKVCLFLQVNFLFLFGFSLVKDRVLEICRCNAIEGRKSGLLICVVSVVGAYALTLEQNENLVDLEIGLPPQFEKEHIVPQRPKVSN